MKELQINPYEEERKIGLITEVGSSYVKANINKDAKQYDNWFLGVANSHGHVNDFVTIDCDEHVLLGRISKSYVHDAERLKLEKKQTNNSVHPLGNIQLLATISLQESKVLKGILAYPKVGASVYSAHPDFVKWTFEFNESGGDSEETIKLNIGHLPEYSNISIALTPEQLFGRHTAVLGTTGGGKSWTLARLMEESVQHNSKSILIDATGEFYTLAEKYSNKVKRVHIGGDNDGKYRDIPYNELLISDLTAIFRPSSQSQAPKLHEAIKSLKLVEADEDLGAINDGLLIKQGSEKRPVELSFEANAEAVENPKAEFNIKNLADQIREECVYSTGGYKSDPDPTIWGSYSKGDLSYCHTLITRINEIVNSPYFIPVFQPQEESSVLDEIEGFLGSDKSLIIISLKELSFQRKVREIVVNAIGRRLHQLAREKEFTKKPVITYLDEAHQFLNQKIRDDFVQYDLDAFESLAKEGRKYGLSVCLATQRPRDIPTGILSQVGTLLVHRLINERDRNVVENACGELDRDVASQLPSLSSGEAVVIGVDFNFPLAIKIREPNQPPDSEGPDYQNYWQCQEHKHEEE